MRIFRPVLKVAAPVGVGRQTTFGRVRHMSTPEAQSAESDCTLFIFKFIHALSKLRVRVGVCLQQSNDKSITLLSYAGKILTIETLPVRLTSANGKRPVVDADQTCYFEENASHVLYMTRIFYCYGTVHEELIGISHVVVA